MDASSFRIFAKPDTIKRRIRNAKIVIFPPSWEGLGGA